MLEFHQPSGISTEPLKKSTHKIPIIKSWERNGTLYAAWSDAGICVQP